MSQTTRFAWQALGRHFDQEDLTDLSSSRRRFAPHLLPDLQSVIEEQLAPLSPKLLGVHQQHEFFAPKLSDLVISEGQHVVALTPLQYQDIDIGSRETFPSLNNGLWLFRIDNEPLAILLSQFFEPNGGRVVQVEIGYLPSDRSSTFARAFLNRIETAGQASRFYRGKILSFESNTGYDGTHGTMKVHDLPAVSREDVVLSDATMNRLDTHVFEFDRYREGLRRLGQSTRKGILLYGPPGTGKTHVIRYIAANLPGRTTVLATAEQMPSIGQYITLARTLQPSIVVLEDVDLVGRSREEINSQKTESLLNRLLNEMDGLAPDADILFILTTNRPEDIEEALASRPGRVDEAIEIPLPDDHCRKRLIALYGQALSFADGAVDQAIHSSINGSAAFVKEMVRRLAQRALSRDGGNTVSLEDVRAVFSDPGVLSSRVNRRIVGLSDQNTNKKPNEDLDNCCE
jgi:hypothetical protein